MKRKRFIKLHYEEDFIWRAFLERKEKENDSE